MRRVISFILVLAFCLSLPITAFAASPSAGESGTPVQRPTYSGDLPKTGDTIMMWIIIMVVAIVALIAVVVIYRKKSQK